MAVITGTRAEGLMIGKLSELTGVNIETIRYYEKVRVLSAPPRTASGRRIYGQAETRVRDAEPGRVFSREQLHEACGGREDQVAQGSPSNV